MCRQELNLLHKFFEISFFSKNKPGSSYLMRHIENTFSIDFWLNLNCALDKQTKFWGVFCVYVLFLSMEFDNIFHPCEEHCYEDICFYKLSSKCSVRASIFTQNLECFCWGDAPCKTTWFSKCKENKHTFLNLLTLNFGHLAMPPVRQTSSPRLVSERRPYPGSWYLSEKNKIK